MRTPQEPDELRQTPAPLDGQPPLPDLHEALLDTATLDQLFNDLEACAVITEIIPRFANRRMVTGQGQGLSLPQARELLVSGQALGLQIRYRYDGADWWDTLMQTPKGVRLVRIRHEFQ